MTLRILSTGVLTALTIIGCGGNHENGDFELPGQFTGPPISESNKNLTLEEIAGIWKFDIEIYGPENEIWAMDEYHVVITANSEYHEYDYKGDSLAERQADYGNCYIARNSGTIVKLPEGGFEIITGEPPLTFHAFTNYELKGSNLLAGATIYAADTTLATPSTVSREEILQMSCD